MCSRPPTTSSTLDPKGDRKAAEWSRPARRSKSRRSPNPIPAGFSRRYWPVADRMLMRLNSPQSRVQGRPHGVWMAVALLTLLVTPPTLAQKYTFEEVASGLKHKDPATRLRAIQILKDADYAEAVVP